MIFLISKKMCSRFLLLILVLIIQACSSVNYYAQGVIGHASLMLARQPIENIIKTADDELKQKLITAKEIRKFSVDELNLPENKSYTSYVDLKNSAPVWNVVAAKEFSLKPMQWCYFVIGCASYRGYYSRQAAEDFAAKLKETGFDVYVGAVGAYSTLGYFADPLTSIMLNRDDASLAELIFHELSHQQLYIKNDTKFNEAFATVVGEKGAVLWLTKTTRSNLLKNYNERLKVQDDFIELINETKRKLKAVYESPLSDDVKRNKKQLIFDAMIKDYEQLKINKWNGKAWYGRWFAEPINNARLVSVATYYDLVPDFVNLFEACDQNFEKFYIKVKEISETEDKIINTSCEI